MTEAAILAPVLGRGLAALRELAVTGDWACAVSYAAKQLAPLLTRGLVTRRDRDLRRVKFQSYRFEYRITDKGRDFLAALDRPSSIIAIPQGRSGTAREAPSETNIIGKGGTPPGAGETGQEDSARRPIPSRPRVPHGMLVARVVEDHADLIAVDIVVRGRAIATALLDADERVTFLAAFDAAGDEADRVRHIGLRHRRFG